MKISPSCWLCAWLLALPCQAATDDDQLTALVNDYRAEGGPCEGRALPPAPALTPQAALSALRLAPGMILSAALEGSGYRTEQADAISIAGAGNAREAMDAMREAYCRALLSTSYTEIGSSRQGQEWTVVLARPAAPRPSPTDPDWQHAGQRILDGINAARASGRTCGDRHYPPAPPLQWNAQLAAAAQTHSDNMARERRFNHMEKDGSTAAERATRAGYAWLRIGENIAVGQRSAQEAVDGWLSSPGHCANLMNPDFSETGAAYSVTIDQRPDMIYWTQVFARPRR